MQLNCCIAVILQSVNIACYTERYTSYSKSVRPSVRLSVYLAVRHSPSHAGIMPKRLQLRSCGLHWMLTSPRSSTGNVTIEAPNEIGV